MPKFNILVGAEARAAIGEVSATAADLVLTSRTPAPPDTLGYKWTPVKTYLSQNCRPERNDCKDKVLATDCTHFVCHALNKTGVFVKLPSVSCASALCVNARELATAFDNSVAKFTNVKYISKYEDTREGDYVFLPALFHLDYYHAMVLAAPAEMEKGALGAKFWAHTNARCGNEWVSFDDNNAVFYRIEESAA